MTMKTCFWKFYYDYIDEVNMAVWPIPMKSRYFQSQRCSNFCEVDILPLASKLMF